MKTDKAIRKLTNDFLMDNPFLMNNVCSIYFHKDSGNFVFSNGNGDGTDNTIYSIGVSYKQAKGWLIGFLAGISKDLTVDDIHASYRKRDENKKRANSTGTMNLYLIEQDENVGYDTYDSAVVVAESEDEARHICPPSANGTWKSTSGSWASSPSNVSVKYLGIFVPIDTSTDYGKVIVASFNAG